MSFYMNRVCYAYTQSSLCLLESVCRCVQMNEPVLLVGETGVGKTTVVNYLSQLTGNCYQYKSTFRHCVTKFIYLLCRKQTDGV